MSKSYQCYLILLGWLGENGASDDIKAVLTELYSYAMEEPKNNEEDDEL